MQHKSNRIPFIILLFILLAAFWSGFPDNKCAAAKKSVALLEYADQQRKVLYKSESKKKYRHHWLNCIQRYQKIYTLYPKSDEAAWALYHAARLYTGLYKYSRNSKDLEEAQGLFSRLVEEHPQHRLADDAQYHLGNIFYKYKKDAHQAYVEFLKVEIKFPSGDMVPKAREKLKELTLALNKEGEKKESKPEPGSGSKRVSVTDIRHWSTPNYTRVVIDLENPVEYTDHLLRPDPDINKPRRLYLDLKPACVTKKIDSPVEIRDGLLRLARAGQYKNDTVRVVLDMETIGGYNVFRLYDPFRIVVDVRRDKNGGGREAPKTAQKKMKVRKGVRKSNAPDTQVSLAQQLGLNVQRIVIDPGHGGKDPGCRSRSGVLEKDVTLRLAKLLAEELRRELGCDVFLTRNKDVFLSLEERTAIANMKNADLFISIHINAHRSSKVWGLETYFLNMATDEQSVAVAARENATSKKNISDLETILESLMLNTKIHESNRLAHEVQKGMVSQVDKRYKSVKSLGVKQAPFFVLIGANMPAILVETGFITNPTEEKRLVSKIYQNCITSGISQGIKAYVKSIDQVYQGG